MTTSGTYAAQKQLVVKTKISKKGQTVKKPKTIKQNVSAAVQK